MNFISQGQLRNRENTLMKSKNLLLQNLVTEPISTKLGTKHPWVKGIQVYSNEGAHTFPRGNNYEIEKIH